LHNQVISMEKKYWIGRQRSAVAMARGAATAEARLIHYELAGRHSIKAAQCLPAVLPDSRAKSDRRREILHLPDLALLRSASMILRPLEPPARREPDGFVGKIR
jgi:hypothetical protein